MPLSLEPVGTHFVWLDSDSLIPIEKRPVFFFKVQSVRSAAKFSQRHDELLNALKSEELPESFKLIFEDVLIDWKNIPKEFSLDNLVDTLTSWELMELFRKILAYQKTNLEEKKS